MEAYDTDPSALSLPERMAMLRDLRKEYGELPDIPAESLHAIGYVGLAGADGIYTVLPEEIADSRKRSVESAPDPHKPPFERLTLEVYRNTGFGSAEPVAQILTKLEQLQRELFYFVPSRICTLPDTDPANRYAEEAASQILVQASDGPRVAFFDSYSELLGVNDTGEKFGFERDSEVLSGELGGLELTYLRIDERSSPLATPIEAEEAWQTLEKIKSYVTDIDEIDKRYVSNFGHYELGDAPSTTTTADLEAAPRINEQKDAFDNTPLRLQSMAADLEGYGFKDIASQLAACTTVQEARTVMAKAIAANELKILAKATEKSMRTARTSIDPTDEQAIRAFAVELSDHKAKTKAEQQRLRGVHDVLFLPHLYAAAAKQKIEQIQKGLVVSKEASRAVLTLDARPNTKLDANPGAKSGDCTDGKPLPFGRAPVYNVKVFDDNRHIGNMYLLEAKNMSGKRVWHLDAIQVPNISYDWDTVAASLVATLSQQAKASGLEMITINSQPYLVSNYDYIGDAFMKSVDPDYMPDTYDSMEDTNAVGASIPTTNVIFPEQIAGHSQFQGDSNDQLILWQDK